MCTDDATRASITGARRAADERHVDHDGGPIVKRANISTRAGNTACKRSLSRTPSSLSTSAHGTWCRASRSPKRPGRCSTRRPRSSASASPRTTGGTSACTGSRAPGSRPSSPGHRPRLDVERPANARGRGRHLGRGAREVPRVPPARRPRDLQGRDLLGAEHQHLPRSALGPRSRDVRRVPAPHGAPGGRVLPRTARGGPSLPEARGHAEALRRPPRARRAAPRLRRGG